LSNGVEERASHTSLHSRAHSRVLRVPSRRVGDGVHATCASVRCAYTVHSVTEHTSYVHTCASKSCPGVERGPVVATCGCLRCLRRLLYSAGCGVGVGTIVDQTRHRSPTPSPWYRTFRNTSQPSHLRTLRDAWVSMSHCLRLAFVQCAVFAAASTGHVSSEHCRLSCDCGTCHSRGARVTHPGCPSRPARACANAWPRPSRMSRRRLLPVRLPWPAWLGASPGEP